MTGVMRRVALTVVVGLVVCAPASAQIFKLSRDYAAGGATSWGWPAGVAPLEGGSLGFAARVAHPRFFQVTVAWDSSSRMVLVGCRGHGDARVSVWLRRHRGGAVTARCRDLSRWRAWLLNVVPGAHVEDSVLITPEARS